MKSSNRVVQSLQSFYLLFLLVKASMSSNESEYHVLENKDPQQCRQAIYTTQKSKNQTFELILAEDYDELDPVLPSTIRKIKERGGHRCWHKHSTFLDHLIGVHNILKLWGQPHIVGRVGLLHSAYSNSYVNLALFDPNNEGERRDMRLMIGEEAEDIVYLFCIINRQNVVVDTILAQGYIPDELIVPHLKDENQTIHLSSEIMKLLVIFTMADVADQYFGWQDRLFGGMEEENSMLLPGHDEVGKHESMAMWPGSSKPGLWMSYISQLGAVLRNHKSSTNGTKIEMPIPPVFESCSKILSRENEKRARDLYWSVVMDLVPAEKVIESLLRASEYNPWFYESYVMLAQKYLHQDENEKAKEAANRALELQMMWGTAYDKRMSFQAWVAWTRVLYQRASDHAGWPTNSWEVNNFGMVH